MRHFKLLALQGTATLALIGALSTTAHAQVVIEDDTDQQIRTSTAGPDGGPSDVILGDDPATEDVTEGRPTITGTGAVDADNRNPAVVLDSSNALRNGGDVVIEEGAAGSVGVELQGGEDRSYIQTGSVSLTEDFTPTDTDDDPFTDGGVAEGSGRTGILISGASPFQGNIEFTGTSSILVEGNDSYAINLENTPMMMQGLTGNLATNGSINIVGDRSVGVNIGSGVTGDLINDAVITARGEDAQGYAVNADIQGGFVNAGSISATGFRFNTRPGFSGSDTTSGREDLGAEDLTQAGSALSISGDVSEGIFLRQRQSAVVDAAGDPVLDDDGNQLFTTTSSSSISQFGGAPAVIIGRDGDPIGVGLIAEITNPEDADFDEDLQFAFINQGTIAANGLFDDIDASAVSISNATLTGGLSNSGSLTASSFRAATEREGTEGDGTARVLVLGDNAIVERINNSGVIVATASEAIDEVFFDRDNILAPRELLAVGIDIGENASVTDLVNSGTITAVVVGRDGQAVAIRDASGTLRSVTNNGIIASLGSSSDQADLEETNFDLIALDVSALTEDFTFTQTASDIEGVTSRVAGDIYLGSGNDSLIADAGIIEGNLDFGGGNDTLTLSGNAFFSGEVTNTDSLTLSVTDTATLALGSAEDINIESATFGDGSTYRPVVDGALGRASTLISDGEITFESGATINPILSSILNNDAGGDTQRFELATGGNITIGDLAGLSGGVSPFLFDSQLSLDGTDTLVITLDLRDPNASLENGGLGLDSVQAAAFGQFVGEGANRSFEAGAAFQALAATPELGNAFANITESAEFYAAINQVLPEFSGASKQFVLANVDGAVGAVGSHLDTTRRSPDKSGGAWLEEFFYFADRELAGLSEQYRGEGFGFTAGLDTALGPFHAVGVSAGFSSTEVEDVVGIDDPLDVRTYTLGTYAGFESGGLSIDAYGGIGYNQFEQNRRISVGDFLGVAQGDWDGFLANASLRAGYMIPLSEKYWVRPRASLDYLYLNEYGHTETGTQGFRTRVDGRRTDTASATAMIDFGANFQGKRTWIRPSVRVGYRNEFISDPVETAFRFQGLQNVDGEVFDSELARLRSLAFPDEGILLGFTVAAGSEYSSIGFDFDSDIRDGFIRHTGRIVIRLLF